MIRLEHVVICGYGVSQLLNSTDTVVRRQEEL